MSYSMPPPPEPNADNEALTRWAAGLLGIPLSEAPKQALSLRQPWGFAVIDLGKDIENRLWPSFKEGWYFIHASTGCTAIEYESALDIIEQAAGADKAATVPPLKELQRGGIIGAFRIGPSGDKDAKLGMNPWAFAGQHHIPIYEARKLPFVPCRGYMKWFPPNVPPPGEAPPPAPEDDQSTWPPIEERIGWTCEVAAPTEKLPTRVVRGVVEGCHDDGRFMRIRTSTRGPGRWVKTSDGQNWKRPKK